MTPRWHKILQKLQASTAVVAGPLPTPCWEWTGPDDGEQGYGRMSLDGHTVKVHRVGYMQFNGYLPPKKHVDHLCRNRRCWNPDHLEAVTHKQNQRRRRKAVLGKCIEGGIGDGFQKGLNISVDELKNFFVDISAAKSNPPLCPGTSYESNRCRVCPLAGPGPCPGNVPAPTEESLARLQQCSCERLGITAGVRGKKRCPGCPKKDEPAPDYDPEACGSCFAYVDRKLGCQQVGAIAAGKCEWVRRRDVMADACYCSEYQSSGVPCPPGRCPNVPKLPATPEWRTLEPHPGLAQLRVPSREPAPGGPTLGLEEPAGALRNGSEPGGDQVDTRNPNTSHILGEK